MKKAGQWKNRMVLALELPPDLAYNETIVTLTGQTEAVIENYKSVFKYTPFCQRHSAGQSNRSARRGRLRP